MDLNIRLTADYIIHKDLIQNYPLMILNFLLFKHLPLPLISLFILNL